VHDDDVKQLMCSLEELIDRARNMKINFHVDYVPGDYFFTEKNCSSYPDIEKAYSKFKLQITLEEREYDDLVQWAEKQEGDLYKKYGALVSSTIEALEELGNFETHGSYYPWAESIRNQIKFIRTRAEDKKNPIKELGDGEVFNYSIISSRNLTSPEEMVLKSKLDRVTENLRNLWED
jgi:hypothetical protein